MIVVEDSSSLLLITQPDHARLAAELLSLWRHDGLPDHPRREDLLFATREHDNGWREADAAPRVDPASRRPYDFSTYPAIDRVEIWQRGIQRYSQQCPYAALLIARHAELLYREAVDAPESWREFSHSLEDQRQGWLQAAAVDQRTIELDCQLLQTADVLSLAVCNRWQEPLDTFLVRASALQNSLRLSPFPLAGATTLRVACRRIPDRPYDGDADLGGELAAARWGELEIHVVPGPAAL